MSVTNQTPVNAFSANGVTTVFNFTFQVLDSSDLRVQVDGADKIIGAEYTVSGIGNPAGGSVTFLSAPAADSSVVVFRDSVLERDTDYQNNGDLRAATVNFDFDRIWLALQEILYGVQLATTLRPGSPLSGTITLPDPGAGKYLRWNLLGNALEAVDGTGTAPGEFLQSGVGAAPRSLQSKVGEVVSVNDFGAKGDGITDDTAAVKAAITAAAGACVNFPNGTYNLASWNANGESYANVNLYGKGAVIRGPASGVATFLRPSGAPVIEGLAFDSWGYVLNKSTADGGTITGGRFERNIILNTSGIGINIEIPTSGFNIVGNVFDGGSCLHAVRIGTNDKTLQTGWKHNTIAGNEVKNLATSGSNNMLGMLIYGMHTKINGNKIRNLRSVDAECIGIYTKLMFSEISGNIIEDITSTGSGGAHADVVGIAMKGNDRAGVGVSPYGYKNVCSGNTVKKIGVQGIKGSAIRTQSEENNISNNVIEDCGYMGIDVNDSGTMGSIVCGNEIRGYNILGLYGIWAACTGIGWVIANNIIRDYPSGIRLDGMTNPNRGGRITGNFISNTGASYGINFGSAVMSNIMINNNTFDVGTAVVINSGSTLSLIKLIENDTQFSKARGAVLWSGTLPADTAIRFNSGHPSHSGGAVSVPNGAGGLVVTHGLFETPSVLHAIGFNNSGMTCTWSAVGATQFTLAHNFASAQSVSYCAYTPHYFK